MVPRAELRDAALELAAGDRRARTATCIRLAKAAINGIDPVDVRRSYRFEQGFTFEANLSGVADRGPRHLRRTGTGEEAERERQDDDAPTRSSAGCAAA